MKKNSIKFLALLAVALPMVMLSSCSDDDDDNKKTENKENTIKATDLKIDGETYVKNNWLKYDEDGNVDGIGIGVAFNESEPTVAYVGVDDYNDAQMHFQSSVKPVNAKSVKNGDNIDAVLVDTLGNEQNRLHFTKIDDGNVIAKVKLDKNIGIERYITEIRYIPTSLWPENAAADSPFKVNCIYTYGGKNYVCVRPFGYGKDGLLVCDKNNYKDLVSYFHFITEMKTANYPNLNTCLQIAKELSSTVSGPQLWQKLCVSANQTNLKEFKKREYWTSTVNDDQITVICFDRPENNYFLTTQSDVFLFWQDDTYSWELSVYKFYTDNKGDIVVKISNNNIWMEKVEKPYAPVKEWTRNEELERKAASISLQ